jgi:hypothetical protein
MVELMRRGRVEVGEVGRRECRSSEASRAQSQSQFHSVLSQHEHGVERECSSLNASSTQLDGGAVR